MKKAYIYIGVGVVLIAGALAWYFLYYKKKKKEFGDTEKTDNKNFAAEDTKPRTDGGIVVIADTLPGGTQANNGSTITPILDMGVPAANSSSKSIEINPNLFNNSTAAPAAPVNKAVSGSVNLSGFSVKTAAAPAPASATGQDLNFARRTGTTAISLDDPNKAARFTGVQTSTKSYRF